MSIRILFPFFFILFFFGCADKEPALPVPTPLPKLVVANASFPEGNTQEVFMFPVQVSGSSDDLVHIGYETRDGTAQAQRDYAPVWGELSFGPGTVDTIHLIPIRIFCNELEAMYSGIPRHPKGRQQTDQWL